MEHSSIKVESCHLDRIARFQRLGANALSLARVGIGVGIFGYAVTNETYRSLPMATTVALASATDYLDGNLARRAAKRLQSSTTRFGQWIDQLSDKAMSHLAFMGFGINSVVNGNTVEKIYGASMIALDSIMLRRDYIATKRRLEAEEYADIKARPQGKIKAMLGMVTLTAAASPLADTVAGQVGVTASLAATTVLAVRSLVDLENSFTTFELPNNEAN